MRAFLAVEQAGSVKGAATELHVTQPSVSGTIASLQKELGVKLIERRGRGMGLTAAGAVFAPYVARTLGLLEEGREAALEAADPERQELRIAAVNTAGEYIVPPVLRAFKNRHPRAELRLEVSNRAGVFRRVELREADIGVGGSPPESGDLDGFPFLENDHVVIAPADHPFAASRELTFRDLEGTRWLMREKGSGTRAFAERLLADKGIRPSTMTIGSNGAIKQAVRAGLGISLQSRWSVTLELAMGLLSELNVGEEIPEREWYVLYPRGGPRRRIVDGFLGFLTDAAARKAITESLAAPVGGRLIFGEDT